MNTNTFYNSFLRLYYFKTDYVLYSKYKEYFNTTNIHIYEIVYKLHIFKIY